MTKRILSAVILIPIVIWLVFFAKKELFGVAILFVNFTAYLEWLNMDGVRFNTQKALYFSLNAPFIFMMLFDRQLAVYALFAVFIFHLVINFSSIKKNKMLQNYYYFLGIIYTALYTFLYFIIIEQNGRVNLTILLVSIWAGDSFAYLCGKYFGKHKLSKQISPKKTIEGAVCGIFFGTFFASLFAYFAKLPIENGFLIGIAANISGIFGDLSESVIKRAFNKKDSSNIIPGHGGVLDRLDSLAFSGFFVYMMVLWKIL